MALLATFRSRDLSALIPLLIMHETIPVNASGISTVTIQVKDYTITSIVPPSGSLGQPIANVQVNGPGFVYGTTLNPLGAVTFNGHNLLLVNTPMTWPNAKSYCESIGGHLATISNGAENQFVFDLGGQVDAWLGATDVISEGNYRWVTGEPFTYTNWNSGQPDNNDGSGHTENCLVYFGLLPWNDASAIRNTKFVCEFEPPPPSVKITKGNLTINGTLVRVTSSSQLLVNFDLTGTIVGQAEDSDGDALNYTWDFGDGTAESGATVFKTYAVAGVYVVTVTVTDGQNNAFQTLNLVVQDQPVTGTFVVEKVKLSFSFPKIGASFLRGNSEDTQMPPPAHAPQKANSAVSTE